MADWTNSTPIGQSSHHYYGDEETVANLNSSTDYQGKTTTDYIEFYVYGMVIPPIAIFGILGNMASLTVLLQGSMISTISICLSGLTTFDLLLLIQSILIYPSMGMCTWYNYPVANASESVCDEFLTLVAHLYPMSLITQTASVWCCILISVERFIAVRHPLQARHYCTMKNSRIALISIAIGAVVYNLPTFFEMRYNSETGSLEITQWRQNEYYIGVYKTGLYLLIMVLAPFLSILVMNSFIIISIRRAVKLRRSLAHKTNPTSLQITVTALVVMFCFLMFNVPALLSYFTEILLPGAIQTHNTFLSWVLVYGGNVCVVLNSSINVIIYCVVGDKFRNKFLQTFFSSIYTPPPPRNYHTTLLQDKTKATRMGDEISTLELMVRQIHNPVERRRSPSPTARLPNGQPRRYSHFDTRRGTYGAIDRSSPFLAVPN